MGFSAGTMSQMAGGLQMAGAGASAVGAYSSVQQQNSLLSAQADISEVNARIAESNARAQLLAGERAAQSSRMKTGQIKGSQRAALAASGVDLGVGSALELQTGTDLVGEVDANAIQADAIRSAWGYRTQGASFENEAIMARAGKGSAAAAAATSLLGSAGTVAAGWYKRSKPDAPKDYLGKQVYQPRDY